MPIEYITDFERLEQALNAERAVLYKHSPVCGVSAAALREVERFVSIHADVPVYVVDVRAQRPLSQKVALRLDIQHESPQAIVIVRGRPEWNASHFDITVESLESAVPGV